MPRSLTAPLVPLTPGSAEWLALVKRAGAPAPEPMPLLIAETTCEWCEDPFTFSTKRNRPRFCSDRCRQSHRSWFRRHGEDIA